MKTKENQLAGERVSEVSPGIPPGCKSVHCDIEGRRPFPNPQRFCTCGYEHAPVKQRVEKKVNNLDIILSIVQERISREAISRVETGSLYTALRNKTFFLCLALNQSKLFLLSLR